MKFGLYTLFLKSPFLLAFLFLITLFISCTKDKENTSPVVNIQLPVSGIQLQTTDTIKVLADIKDDHGPLSVKYYIADAANNALTIPVYKSTSSNEIAINEFYFFSNKYIETGTYYLVVHAEDGKNQTNKFLEVEIIGLPLELISVFAGVRESNGIRIYKTDSSGNYVQTVYLQGEYADIEINNYTQQFYTLSRDGHLSCYSLPSFQLEWEKGGFNYIGSYYDGQLLVYDQLMYVTDANGSVKGYDGSGVLRKAFNMVNGSPKCFNFTDSRLFVYTKHVQTNEQNLEVFSLSTGLLNSYLLNYQIRKIFHYSNNNVLLIAQNSTQIQPFTYNFEISYLYPLNNPYSEVYWDAIETYDEKYILSTNVEMKLIEKIYGNSNIYALGKNAQILKFEQSTGLLYLCDSNQISILNYPNTQVMNSTSLPEKILFLDYLYNK